MTEKERAQKILTLLKTHYPEAKMILTYSTTWELLVAVILSAQCTDVMVNKVTPQLFARYKTIKDYADASKEELETYIKSTGFYHNKAKNIIGAAKMVYKTYHGAIPNTMEEMLKIPGVARKTANVVLGNAYAIYEGIAVDTHVKRLSERLRLSKQNTPEKIEKDLMALFEKKDWFPLTYLLIEHARRICKAKKPACDDCFLQNLCPLAFQFPHFQKNNS